MQVALSLILLVGTGLLIRSTRALTNVDPGLARDRLLIVTVDAAPTNLEGDRLAQLARVRLERIRSIPGVAAATFSENGLFSGTESSTTLGVDGFTPRAVDDTIANYDRVGPGYVRRSNDLDARVSKRPRGPNISDMTMKLSRHLRTKTRPRQRQAKGDGDDRVHDSLQVFRS